MLGAQARDRKAEPGQRAGLEVLHEHVGARQQDAQQALVVVLGEVEHDRFLAAIEPHEIRALAVHHVVIEAGEVAFRPLDLDDARTGIGQPAGAGRRRHRLLKRHDEEV